MFTPLTILVAADTALDPNAGAAGTVYQTNCALRRLGHEVHEIWSDDLGRRIQHGNLHYLLELPYTYQRALKRQLQTSRFDVVEFNQPHAYLAAKAYSRMGLPGVFVNRSHGHEVRVEQSLRPWKKVYTHARPNRARSITSSVLRCLLNRHWNLITRYADGFHVSCSEDRDFLEAHYGIAAARIGVIPQGVPERFISTSINSEGSDRNRRILYVGQYAFVKGAVILAKVIERILISCPDVTMTWVCSKQHHHSVQALLTKSVLHRLRLLDWMAQDDLIGEYDRHGIFLFPSFFEGFGKAPLEAMSRGLAVIASDTGGMKDLIRHQINGLLVPVGDIDGFTALAIELIRHPDNLVRLGKAARDSAIHYSWERCATDLVAFYRALLMQKGISTVDTCRESPPRIQQCEAGTPCKLSG